MGSYRGGCFYSGVRWGCYFNKVTGREFDLFFGGFFRMYLFFFEGGF